MSQEETVVADIDGRILTSAGQQVAQLGAVDEPERLPLEKVKQDGDATFELLKNALSESIIQSLP